VVFVEAAEEQIKMLMQPPIRMILSGRAAGALTLMNAHSDSSPTRQGDAIEVL
jgi:hypothetical protein